MIFIERLRIKAGLVFFGEPCGAGFLWGYSLRDAFPKKDDFY
jgi:hypothetical protein